MSEANAHPLDRLFAIIESRRGADPAVSYTAKLLGQGTPKCAKKLGEEAVEASLAAVSGDRAALIAESADLVYHLLVVWAACGVTPAEVYAALSAREANLAFAKKRTAARLRSAASRQRARAAASSAAAPPG
jgi:phosphoribosyl-ATP pyrophosphohydrolase